MDNTHIKATALCILAAFTLGVVMSTSIKTCGHSHVEPSKPLLRDSIWYWHDKYNQEHARSENQAVEMSVMKDTIQAISDRLNIKAKQVEGQQHITGAGTGTFIGNLWPVVGGSKFEIVSPYHRMTGMVKDSFIVINRLDSIVIDITPYWQRSKRFLGISYGRIRHYVDVTSPDTTLHLTGVSSWHIQQKQPGRFGIGPYVGIDTKLRPAAGIAFTYSIIRF